MAAPKPPHKPSLSARAIRWRCRRGTRELDTLLMRFADLAYESMSNDDRALFARMLELDDPLLSAWLSGVETAEDKDFARFVDAIRAANRHPD